MRRNRVADRAAQLYGAAIALFAEHGYREVGVDDIVASCGVSRGTFYGYFRNKRDLLDAILASTIDDLVSAVAGPDDWSVLADAGAYEARFRAMVRRVLQHFADNAPLLSFVILTAPGVDSDAFTFLLAGYERVGCAVEAVLTEAARRGWMHDASAAGLTCTGQMVISCIAAAALPLLLDTGDPLDLDEVARLCADYLIGGLPAVL